MGELPRADDAKVGTVWHADDLDAIVADYFEMLGAELAGNPYVKLAHSRALMLRIGRTLRSVEFKHQNISAVLEELGLPWIPGYKPKRNYQNAIFDAIDRFLTLNPGILEPAVKPPQPPATLDTVFVQPPSADKNDDGIPAPLRRLVRKFDPVIRDQCNRSLGKAGEEYIVELERRRLAEADRLDLARRVRWVAAEDGDGAGYDVLSFDLKGQERLLEVKTTNGSERTPFYLTRNECSLPAERPLAWRIYRVHLFATRPRVFTLAPPLDQVVNLRPEVWRASF